MSNDTYYLLACLVLFVLQWIEINDHNKKLDMKCPDASSNDCHASSGFSIFAIVILSFVMIGKVISYFLNK